MKIHPLFVSVILLAACMHTPSDHAVNLQLSNGGAEPLSCKIVYGHWVERDLERLNPGTTFDIALRQQPGDHALFIYRDDMQRRLMIENILCGRLGDWRDTSGQVDLGRPRQANVAYLEATCAAPAGAGRVACQLTDIAPKE
jgi:hypothetical protein